MILPRVRTVRTLQPEATLFRRLIGWLLHRANSSPPGLRREEFYAMKDRILARFGTRDGYDVQKIVKPCCGCDGTGRFGPRRCHRCYGDGVYRTLWTRLDRWKLGRYSFHTIAGPCLPVENPSIVGYVRHQDYGPLAGECQLWLGLLFDRRFFWSQMGSAKWCVRTWLPLVTVRKAAWAVRSAWRRVQPWRCSICRGRLWCNPFRPCRRSRCGPCDRAFMAAVDDEIPF